ncbi:hypothetical protein [Synechococcus sp. PCC 6312]|uniref:hypothetical protein n=1 Tax=Synechococcus sp. (strain ATCC 27167 / PCC 6312) TaxID=195253 RepID=UPI00029F4036|nr:hypothetical protein [Synechococcus sp. PCC 6312]AFY60805.1 hypothetical protein Syn6312_1646 [Synechococcus sp. PCC 6312]
MLTPLQRLAGLLTGATLTAVGMIFVWSGLPHTELVTCQQNQVRRIDCQKEHKVLWWLVLKSVPLDNIQSVSLGLGENTESDPVYRLDFRNHQDTLEFGHSLSENQVKAELMQAKTFMTSPSAALLKLSRFHQAWGFVILGLPIAALGLGVIRHQFIGLSPMTKIEQPS